MLRSRSHASYRIYAAFLIASFALGACDEAKTLGVDAGKPEEDGGREPPKQCQQDEDCDDLNACNGVEACLDGACTVGEAVVCDDGIACTRDLCDPVDGACTHRAQDNDGDGAADARCKDSRGAPLGADCDDQDPLRYPGNVEICDQSNHDEDCNPETNGELDIDKDGYTSSACCNPESDAEDAKLLCGRDCDDFRENVSPEATEACDGLDNNCDGQADEGVLVDGYPDRTLMVRVLQALPSASPLATSSLRVASRSCPRRYALAPRDMPSPPMTATTAILRCTKGSSRSAIKRTTTATESSTTTRRKSTGIRTMMATTSGIKQPRRSAAARPFRTTY